MRGWCIDGVDHRVQCVEPGDQGVRRHSAVPEKCLQPIGELREDRVVRRENRGGEELNDEHEVLTRASELRRVVGVHRRKVGGEPVERDGTQRVRPPEEVTRDWMEGGGLAVDGRGHGTPSREDRRGLPGRRGPGVGAQVHGPTRVATERPAAHDDGNALPVRGINEGHRAGEEDGQAARDR